MDLRQLEYFVNVAELGSFSRAALALDVAQPALSRQVRLLEVELRQNLLQRHGRGAVPTEAGQVLLEHARGILHQVGRARDELARLRGGLTGRVAVGLPPSVARALAVPLVRAFGRQLPEAHLSIAEALSTNMQEQVASGRLDIAVLYNARPVPGLEIAPLAMDELVLVQSARAPRHAPSGTPVGLPELARLPLVIPSRPNAIRMHVEHQLAAIGAQPVVALEIDGVAAILDLVADGAGCAVLSRHALAAGARPAIFQLRPIEIGPGQRLQIPLFTAASALRPGTGAQRAVLALLHELTPHYLG
ncbi:MAG TPA: LysR substrate-binding domain-containing protein [Ottowia sp.]|uniref:LysR substrate-binding domain-containing protein n=1 Tax=Ottowia sp. TaxID=1898956 RepID=UPI001DAC4E02|nr:LysR substrate-binding domain-containing protein [Ottowia sp.]MBS0401079.1 LysR family transcriptional regulator [Pseudomonadota bacterium]MBS0415752.1 LysR family transcriptional regulator [Pseudomonadota bacterium]HMN56817.1 LysR substrate-binding domain-containing protein [Ottowia sp.]